MNVVITTIVWLIVLFFFRLLEEIGSGEFGKVYKGVWSHTEEGSNALLEEEVAVKTMRGGVTEEEKLKFLQEAANIAQFKHHFVICMRGLVMDSSVSLASRASYIPIASCLTQDKLMNSGYHRIVR